MGFIVKLSVIWPFYKKEPYIGRSIWTYVKQTLAKELWEIIIVNVDVDKTALLQNMVTFLQNSINIELINVRDRITNLSRNYNIGIRQATGNIIALSDPEIMIYPWVLHDLYYSHLNNDRVFAQAGFLCLLTGEEQCLLDTINWQDNLDNILKLREKNLSLRLTGNIRLISVRKKWFEEIGGFDEDFEYLGHQDDDIYHRLRNSCFVDYPNGGLHLKSIGPSLSLEPSNPKKIACFHQCHGGPMNLDSERQKQMKKLLENRRNKLIRNEGREWGVL